MTYASEDLHLIIILLCGVVVVVGSCQASVAAGNTETCDWHCWHRSSYLLISLVQHTKICRTCDCMCDSSSE